MSQTLFMIGAGVIARLHAHATAKLGEPVRIFVTDPSAAAIEQAIHALCRVSTGDRV